MNVRIGHGYDAHRFGDDLDRPCVLGGVVFDGVPGLVGHSDADAVVHAIIDALLAATGSGDIGQRFPDTDPAWAGADSVALLGVVRAEITAAGFEVGNVDCSLVAERPKVAPRRAEIERRLSEVLGAPVTVKGRRNEGLDDVGAGLGVICHAVALVAVVEVPPVR